MKVISCNVHGLGDRKEKEDQGSGLQGLPNYFDDSSDDNRAGQLSNG